MPDFNAAEPKKPVTDPKGLGANTEFPRHLHKYQAPPTGDAIKAGAHYTSGEYLVVNDKAELDAALADGWSLQPVLKDPDAPKEPKEPKGKK